MSSTAKLTELSEELFRLRFRSATEKIDNPIRFRDHPPRDRAAEDGAWASASASCSPGEAPNG